MILCNHGHARQEVREYPLSALRLYFEGLVSEHTGEKADESRFDFGPSDDHADYSDFEAEREAARKKRRPPRKLREKRG